MKNLITFILFINYVLVFSQKNINEELAEAEKYTNKIIENNPDKILCYYKLNNGTLKRYYSNNDNNEDDDSEIMMSYRIIKKNNKIIYISKSDSFWGMGDWNSSQDFYFDEKEVLLGAVKKEDWFLENKCARQIRYRGIYKNYEKPQLHRVDKFYNENDKEIDLDSPNCKKSKKDILENVDTTDKITFRDVEGFMKAEKIKHFNSEKEESKTIKNPEKNYDITDNVDDPLGGDQPQSLIGINRKLIAFIPGTMGREGGQPSHSCEARGSIMITYTVDKAGNVVSARRSGGISDSCIVSASIGWIKKYVKAEKADVSSMGTYKITF